MKIKTLINFYTEMIKWRDNNLTISLFEVKFDFSKVIKYQFLFLLEQNSSNPSHFNFEGPNY
jgi:hypothetical protein